ncbi:MAG: iron-containing alcohol dehydrogenase [Bacilli bacterium]
MNNFYYNFPTTVFFGEKSIDTIIKNGVLNGYKNILILTAGELTENFNILDKLEQGVDTKFYIEHTNLSNPSTTDVQFYVDKYKSNNIDFVISIGGGSVIDCAKLFCLTYNGDIDVDTALVNNTFSTNILEQGVFVSVPASGSEANSSFVIVNKDFKKLARANDNVRPKFAVLDYNYVKTLPKEQLYAAISDIMSHLLEQYLSNEAEITLIDDLIIATMKTVIRNQKLLLEDSQNYRALEDIMLSATFALSYLLSMGKSLDWNAHEIEHAISGRYKSIHGHGLAILFPKYLKLDKVSKYFESRLSYLTNELFEEDSLEQLDQFYAQLCSTSNISDLVNEFDLEVLIEDLFDGREYIGKNCLISEEDVRRLFN